MPTSEKIRLTGEQIRIAGLVAKKVYFSYRSMLYRISYSFEDLRQHAFLIAMENEELRNEPDNRFYQRLLFRTMGSIHCNINTKSGRIYGQSFSVNGKKEDGEFSIDLLEAKPSDYLPLEPVVAAIKASLKHKDSTGHVKAMLQVALIKSEKSGTLSLPTKEEMCLSRGVYNGTRNIALGKVYSELNDEKCERFFVRPGGAKVQNLNIHSK